MNENVSSLHLISTIITIYWDVIFPDVHFETSENAQNSQNSSVVFRNSSVVFENSCVVFRNSSAVLRFLCTRDEYTLHIAQKSTAFVSRLE